MTQFIESFSEEIWTQTYKDHNDVTVDDNLRRVAKAISSVESTEQLRTEWEQKFYDLLTDFKGTCGGRTYSNAGTEWKGTTLLNCFVSPRGNKDLDSLNAIVDDLKNQAFTLKSEGGWGQNFSWIRPRGAFIAGVGVETPGAVKYMELYDKASEIITSGSGKKSTNKKAKGKIRKGAMMGVLDVWHPDIVEFITAKQSSGRLTKFNISVNFTNEFMERLEAINSSVDQEEIEKLDVWSLKFPDTSFSAYETEWDGNLKKWESLGYPTIQYQTISVRWLWNLVMESTYNRAEPGVLFLDRANEFNPLYYGETIVATNPCVSGDTIVTTNKGEIVFTELVDRVKNGETFKALTYNTTTKKNEYEDVVFADKTRVNANIIQIELEDGKILKLTPDHKVYTSNRGYVKAAELTEEDHLVIQ